MQPTFYRVFKWCQYLERSCNNWQQFGSARKITKATGLTLEQARDMCNAFNENRSKAQIRRGTRLEFEAM